ncbi:putative Uracil-DNA glycosylase superfamily [Candidatus Accumulibacter aalborgensis]|uniref:Putative Uracil-DNA glycosylase superfamily n=1 Tax=Candidatus Accumulibacter aalborgensis TaxID=1860102 RepID=A0A1A8XUJ4_9PROT|nr:uracil-DNA glycosylase family protein [Candidatus Accumulibacter aalborgensis]SBT08729.1 putative Uracil-DNA glycosylase superfamily [Candidatus Accumulibacter aalborgensis]
MNNSYQAFDETLRNCRKCAAAFANHPIDPRQGSQCVAPRPIVSGIRPRPVMLIGQAPGLTEYQTGKPFQGDAGQVIRNIFDELGLPRARFDQLVYSSAVIKCFPGSKPALRAGKTREDVLPTAEMIRNCLPIFEGQIRLTNPQVIVILGSLPLKAYLKLTGRKSSEARLEQFVGRKEDWYGRTIVFFPHTSGASRWLNEPENRSLFQQARALLRSELIERGITSP